MSDTLKLTDEMIAELDNRLAASEDWGTHHSTKQFIEAIRALRDAARAVVEAEKQGIWIVVERRIGDLEELLPDSEVKP